MQEHQPPCSHSNEGIQNSFSDKPTTNKTRFDAEGAWVMACSWCQSVDVMQESDSSSLDHIK
jgi:hypothetical protein